MESLTLTFPHRLDKYLDRELLEKVFLETDRFLFPKHPVSIETIGINPQSR